MARIARMFYCDANAKDNGDAMSKPQTRRLTSEEYSYLSLYYDDMQRVNDGETDRTGTHMMLMLALQRLGFKTNGTREAAALAEELLNG